MSRIRIRNFGPIKDGVLDNDGWIEVNRVTVFTGNQGAGKSTVAKLISFFTWLEKDTFRLQAVSDTKARSGIRVNLSQINAFRDKLAYQNIDEYLKEDTEIEYIGEAYRFHFANGNLETSIVDIPSYHLPKIMYVPAERNFVSAVSNVNSLKGLPRTLYTFADEFSNALRNLNGRIDLPINDTQFKYDNIEKTSHIIGADYKVSLSNSSSGFQSLVPLYLVSQYLANPENYSSDRSKKNTSIEDEKRMRQQIEDILTNPNLSEDVKQASLELISRSSQYTSFVNIVEEPEQNLFPSSQQQMLYSLLKFNNLQPDSKLILTTHSPYIIMYLSLAIQAHRLSEEITPEKSQMLTTRLNHIVPLESLITSDTVNIYELSEKDGTIRKLKFSYGVPSDENYLNTQLNLGNILFDQLLEIEEEL